MVKLKLSYFFMERTRSQLHKAIYRKWKRNRNRKRKMQGIDGNLSANKHNPSDNAGVDKLPDDVLVNILSRVNLKEAARTSVLARRWRYLWRFVFGTLRIYYRDAVTATGDVMEVEKFESWVNTVLELHQGRYIEGMVINFDEMREHYHRITPRIARTIDSWIYFALQKEVQRFELHLSYNDVYEFPSIEMLISHSNGVSSPFCRLRTLRLVDVRIKDEVVNYLLASCPSLEQLCLEHCLVTNNLQVVDPPSLRVLEINKCYNIQSLEISAVNLVSLEYMGLRSGLLLKKIPNLRELTISDHYYLSFVSEPKEHSSYLDQLVKLVLDLRLPTRGPIVVPPELPQYCSLKRLEVKVLSIIGRSLLFFTSFIKASPQLCEFRIEMEYVVGLGVLESEEVPFPAISAAQAVKFDHRSLKVVEMAGFLGCSNEGALLLELLKIAPLIERVVIDTQSEYYDYPELATLLSHRSKPPYCPNIFGVEYVQEIGATTRSESKERAKRLVSTFPLQIKFIVT